MLMMIKLIIQDQDTYDDGGGAAAAATSAVSLCLFELKSHISFVSYNTLELKLKI